MEIRRLSYFVTIAEEGSLSRAADVLGIAQPALSRQMRLLEENIGASLFNRTRHGMQLTEEGQQLCTAVTGPLRQLELAFKNAQSSTNRIEGNFTLGMPAAVEYILGLPIAQTVKESAPGVKLRIVEDHTDHLVDRLIKGEIDLAILYGPSPNEHLVDGDLLTEDLLLVGGPNSILSAHKLISFKEIASLPLILPGLRHGTRSAMDKTAKMTQTKLNIQFEVDSLNLTKELIESGQGYGILPYSSFSKEMESKRFNYAEICEPKVSQHIILAGMPQNGTPRIVKKLTILIAKQVTELIEKGEWRAEILFDLNERKR